MQNCTFVIMDVLAKIRKLTDHENPIKDFAALKFHYIWTILDTLYIDAHMDDSEGGQHVALGSENRHILPAAVAIASVLSLDHRLQPPHLFSTELPYIIPFTLHFCHEML